MQPSDRDLPARGDIITFPVDTPQFKGLLTTLIAALVELTIVSDKSVTLEDKLLELIESSGEAEVMDSQEALDLLEEPVFVDGGQNLPKPVNDNY